MNDPFVTPEQMQRLRAAGVDYPWTPHCVRLLDDIEELKQWRDGLIEIVNAVAAILAEYGHRPDAIFGVSPIEHTREAITKALREALNAPRAEHAQTLEILREVVDTGPGPWPSKRRAMKAAEQRLKENGVMY